MLDFKRYKDLPNRKKIELKRFVNETYKRNGIENAPKIDSVGFGNEGTPLNIIVLKDGMELYHNILWADKENNKKLKKLN